MATKKAAPAKKAPAIVISVGKMPMEKRPGTDGGMMAKQEAMMMTKAPMMAKGPPAKANLPPWLKKKGK